MRPAAWVGAKRAAKRLYCDLMSIGYVWEAVRCFACCKEHRVQFVLMAVSPVSLQPRWSFGADMSSSTFLEEQTT